MAHYAELDETNTVTRVLVCDSQEWLEDNLGGVWVQTSYNTRGGVHHTEGEPSADQSKALRYNFAGKGYAYDEERDAFIPPKPFDSWILNEETCLWEAPIPYPNDGLVYSWDEVSGDWIEVVEPSA